MGCSVLTVVAALYLVDHLSVVAGQANGQRNSHSSEAAEDLSSSLVVTEAHEPSAVSDWRLSVAHVTATDSRTLLTWDDTTAASLDVVTPAPENFVFKSDWQKNLTTTPDDVVTTPKKPDVTTTTEDYTTTPPEDSFSTPPEHTFTKPSEDITASHQSIISTTQEYVADTHEGVGDLIMTPLLEDGRVPTLINQLVICTCPLPTVDGCRRFLSKLYIEGKNDLYHDVMKPLASLRVEVHNVTCEKEDHRLMNFSEGQFFFRDRGDLVLRNVGYLEGLRVNNYCADPLTDNYGYVKWTIKACIPPPSVPRCCPLGQALTDGKCVAANSPLKLEPPMSAGIKKPSINWPVINNHYHPLNCTPDPPISIPLVPDDSYLVALPTGIWYSSDRHIAVPTGLIHIWYPADGHVQRKYTYPPEFCVDGHVEASGAVRYTANICYTHPEELHRRVCDGHTCVRKCCKDNEEWSLSLYRCIPINTTTYTPKFSAPPGDYRIVNGPPLCVNQILLNKDTVDSLGRFHFHGETFTAREYCVDRFNDGMGKVFNKAKLCVKTLTEWEQARKTALPICQIISLVFLMLTVLCNCLVPKLLQGGGWYQLFHVVSLMLAYASMLPQELFGRHWTHTLCWAMGIAVQFGFLSTFFWLNVLCFEVWRKIRSLNKFLPAATVPVWAYVLYAFGVPAAIGTLTVCMQLYAPDDVPGVVKPSLARSRCFFENRLAHFLYFYGPIAFLFLCNITCITHTLWTYRKLEQNASILKKNSAENPHTAKKTMEHTQRKRDYVSDFKQQFSLLVLMSSCWIAEVLSWVIPPAELWSLTDVLNSLQGFFIFMIFIANRSKRKHLRRKFPLPFKMAQHLKKAVQQCCCQGKEGTCLAPVNSLTSQISRKLSSSSVISNLSTLSSSLKFSVSSVSVSLCDEQGFKKPYVFEPEGGVVTLSHSSIPNVSCYETGDTQC